MTTKTLGREGELNFDQVNKEMTDFRFYESRLHIVPISDMRDTTKISELAEDGLVCVTKNGYEHLRIMTGEMYRNLIRRITFLEMEYNAMRAMQSDDDMTLDEGIAIARKANGL